MLISAEKGLKVFSKILKIIIFGQFSEINTKKGPSIAQTENNKKNVFDQKCPQL